MNDRSQGDGLASNLLRLHWARGLRAGVAVALVMSVCHLLDIPFGWPALGSLQVLMVDNGGPYRSRAANFLAVLGGGTLAVACGVLAGRSLPLALAVTIPMCFAFTLARVLSQPLAATSVINLVTYIVAYGSADHSTAAAASSTGRFVLGGLWAALLSLAVWPADPFRPARQALAEAFAALRAVALLLPDVHEDEASMAAFNASLRLVRPRLEAAQDVLTATPARMSARTVRARSLTVLTECADLLLARLLQVAELAAAHPDTNLPLQEFATWLDAALTPIEHALDHRPADPAQEFAPDGSRSTDLRRSCRLMQQRIHALAVDEATRNHLRDAVDDSRFNLGIAFDAAQALWTGAEPFTLRSQSRRAMEEPPPVGRPADLLRANLTLDSVMFRHAVRLTTVVAADVVLMRFIHVTHGYWLAMTSLILLQPFTGETVKRAGERIAGTVSGALLAALLAALIHDPWITVGLVSAGALLAVGTYGVNYAVYCFFLTPTIVMLALPHPGDWRFAVVRAGMTFAGALISLAAMLLLWPERESQQIPALLARAADAEAAYLRAVLAFWHTEHSRVGGLHRNAERELLAPARRRCGLASNDAEEALDRALLERDLPLNPLRSRTTHLHREALTFVTYLRRLTQSTTAAANLTLPLDAASQAAEAEVQTLANRLAQLATRLRHTSPQPESGAPATWQLETEPQDDILRRMNRQVEVLEHAAEAIDQASR